jgi:rhamnulokinase
MDTVAAVDIGATSGRVMVARIGDSGPVLSEAARFANHPQQVDGRWVWDIRTLHREVTAGLEHARALGASAWGIDTWAVDYAVLRAGEITGPVYAYRDPGHAAGMALVDAQIDWPTLYGITGIQRMPINTVYQIAADTPQRLVPGSTFLMVPDVLTYLATGSLVTDITNASSTGLVDPRTRQWAPEVFAALGLEGSCFLEPDEPGQVRGETFEVGGLPLIGVATHDTASAFAGAPVRDRDQALILSLGTWALIGAEVIGAVPNEQARVMNLTHELGVDGTVRVLRNVCGMWLLEECRRAWARQDGAEPQVPALLQAAAAAPALATIFDVDAPELAAPGQTPESIERHLVGRWDGSRGSVVRTILESLVWRIAERAHQVEEHLGTSRPILHVVGGASRMDMVMQWLADATGKQVIAGPVEATALGNAAVQWRTLGAVDSLAQARTLIAGLPEIRSFAPVGNHQDWQEFGTRLTA